MLMAACQLPGQSSTCNSQIDWVSFVQVGSTQYVAGTASKAPSDKKGRAQDLVYSEVKHQLSGTVRAPAHTVKDARKPHAMGNRQR